MTIAEIITRPITNPRKAPGGSTKKSFCFYNKAQLYNKNN